MNKEYEDFFKNADEMLKEIGYSDEYRVLLDEIWEVRNKISDLESSLSYQDYVNSSRQNLIDNLKGKQVSAEELLKKICAVYNINCDTDDYISLEFWASNNKDCYYESNTNDVEEFVEEFLGVDFEGRREDDIELYAREHNHINGCPDLEDIIADCKEECVAWCSLQNDIRQFFVKDTRFLKTEDEQEMDSISKDKSKGKTDVER